MALSIMQMFPDDRHGYLYALSLAQHGDIPTLRLLDVCQQYYVKFKTKPFCFNDLRRSISLLEQHERTVFLDLVGKDTSAEDPDERLIVMKFNFCFWPGLQEKCEGLEQLSRSALELYESCRKQSRACPEAGFLAAVVLVKIAEIQDQHQSSGRSTYCEVLLQAAMLLENCQTDQKHGEEYYPYLVLLIRIQQMLGLMSMALLNCKNLNVKNIQFESVGYFLLERISTLHPRQVGKITPSEDIGFSPLEQLDLALEMLERSESTLTQQINAGLGSGTYPNVLKAVQMRSSLQRSINREVFAYEHLKTRRLTGLLDEGGHPIPDYPLVDQRDFSFHQTYEASGNSPLQSLQLGPLTNEWWLNAMSLYDKLFFYLRSEMQSQSGMSEKAIHLLEHALEKIDAKSDIECGRQLTESESNNLTVHKALGRLILQSKDSAPSQETQRKEDLDLLELWLESEQNARSGCVIIRGIWVPSWKYLHASFTALETIQAVSLFLSVASKKTSRLSKALSLPKETIVRLQLLVVKAEAAIHQQAKDVKRTLNETGVLGTLVEVLAGRSGDDRNHQSEIGEAIEKQGDAARHETFCGDMKGSWEDAVDGILACRIKLFQ